MESNTSPDSNSSTLFVYDIPSHLQEKEFTNLFSSCDGFLGARLRQDRNDNIVGFVDFDEHSSAARARERFQDYKFNPLTEQGISVHFSHPKTRSQQSNNRDRDRDRDNRQRKPLRSNKPRYDNRSGPTPDSFYSPFHHPAFGYNTNSMNYPPLPPEACSTLYVEGLPLDATEREVAHIFRPWAGFQSLRVLPKESKQYPNKMYILCFVEFDNKYQSTIAMHALQGYKMDKNDMKGLTILYAKTDQKTKQQSVGKRNNNTGDNDNKQKKEKGNKSSNREKKEEGSGSSKDSDEGGNGNDNAGDDSPAASSQT